MYHSKKSTAHRVQRPMLGLSLLAGLIGQAYAQQEPVAAATPDAAEPVVSIVVSGYRAALQTSAREKQRATGFQDAVFAEDIGKFPDSNIAESLNRIPGVQIGRNIAGEGTTVQIRGLGPSFTKVTLNGAPFSPVSSSWSSVGVATGGGRDLDLNILPTDLFTKLTVSKSPNASQSEGGAAGTVDLRSARPFDKQGQYVAVSLDGAYSQEAGRGYPKGSIVASKTWGDSFGVLMGVSYANTQRYSKSWEAVGWTNPNLTAAQSSSPGRNSTGGGNWTIPALVPANAGGGLVAGTPIDQAFLLAHNPGVGIDAIDNGYVARLARPMTDHGNNERTTGIISAEYRPTTDLHFYLDTLYSSNNAQYERTDMNFVARSSGIIPTNYQVDRSDCARGCVVTSADYANAYNFLEYRLFREDGYTYNLNPGMEWKLSDKLKLNAQANYGQSLFHREMPTIILATQPGLVHYSNTSGTPAIQSAANLNDPNSFGWVDGVTRVQIQDERRVSRTKGARSDVSYGDKAFTIKLGVSYDDWMRRIRNYDNSIGYQAATCGNNPSLVLPAPNTMASCAGANTPGASAAALFPGYGSAYTAGQTGVPRFNGSLVPAAALPGYLMPGPDGYVTMDWSRFATASNYQQFHDATVETAATALTTPAAYIQEGIAGAFIDASGDLDLAGASLRYDAGVRYARTRQSVGAYSAQPDPRNTSAILNGGRYPDVASWVYRDRSYSNVLPSASVAYNLRKDIVLRAAASKSMTRADPTLLRPGITFTSTSADIGSIGNPDLDPFTSNNLDVGVEWYTGREGYLSATVFGKRIKGLTVAENVTLPFGELAAYGVTYNSLTPIQKVALDARGGPGAATVVMTRTRNAAGYLDVKGVELGWVQPLDNWLPLKGFGFNENFTYVNQQASGEAAGAFVALGVPKKSNNLTLYYERDGYMARLSHTYSDGFQVTGANQNGVTQAAIFRESFKQLDFSSSVDLERVLDRDGLPTLTFNIANANNARLRYFNQYSNATEAINSGGRTYSVGLRMKF
ncbi:TonB-dependent receptor [Duganella aceris]|uniref:TonB-dependent receptor n=1 Tax=Duganella aceris TaxID=2703883 RepID=A0ABX0FQG1_9BURK|nr:TonB-dependent receptor [Duganella aceris]NGZ86876.1 TonB-dependent receptor [Duganella aceris]